MEFGLLNIKFTCFKYVKVQIKNEDIGAWAIMDEFTDYAETIIWGRKGRVALVVNADLTEAIEKVRQGDIQTVEVTKMSVGHRGEPPSVAFERLQEENRKLRERVAKLEIQQD